MELLKLSNTQLMSNKRYNAGRSLRKILKKRKVPRNRAVHNCTANPKRL
jgi:hypothetical protein